MKLRGRANHHGFVYILMVFTGNLSKRKSFIEQCHKISPATGNAKGILHKFSQTQNTHNIIFLSSLKKVLAIVESVLEQMVFCWKNQA